MQRLRNFYASLPPRTRNVFITLGVIAISFLIFSLLSIKDLLAPASINESIVNPIPMVLCVVGFISAFLASQGKIRLSSYLMITSVIVGFILTAVLSAGAIYSTIAELMIVVIPIMIAIQGLNEREFTWIVIISLVIRSVIDILSINKTTTLISGSSSQTESFAEWISAIVALLFGLYVAFNLNNFPFRIKLILVLGILAIIPAAVLTNISRQNLESNLISQANQNLVLSSDQLSNTIVSYIQTNLDTVRTEAQVPALEAFIATRGSNAVSTGIVLPRNTGEETAARQAVWSLLKKDPINIISIRLIDSTGTIQMSTAENELGNVVSEENFFSIPFSDGLPNLSTISVSDEGAGVFHFSAPIRSISSRINGILDIVYSASVLQEVLVRNSSNLGSNVSAMVLDPYNIILAHSSSPGLIYKIVNPPNKSTITNLVNNHRLPDLKPDLLTVEMTGLTSGLENLSTIQYFSGYFTPNTTLVADENSTLDQASASLMASLNWHVVTFVPQNTLLIPVQAQSQRIVVFSIIISLLSILIALGLTQVLIAPILTLTHTSERIAGGEIDATAPVRTHDEIGSLSISFNAMTERIRSLIGGLEQRVAERTQALERRAVQLQAAGEVGSTVARLRNLDELLKQVSRLISQRFGFYHIGIFLLDEHREYAILRASNSDGGQRMLARQHRLKVGEVGIVGNVASSAQARIALNVGDAAEYFSNPDLPLTQSEMALPLVAGGKTLGVLDIQSTESEAFTEEDVTTLKVLADQIAVAIENARLFSESQTALETAKRAYGEISLQGWRSLLQGRQKDLGYISLSGDEVVPVSGEVDADFHQAIEDGLPILTNQSKTLHIPITIRGKIIGAIRMDKKRQDDKWSSADVNMAVSLSEQLGNALESARLYADISQRAERESIISEIASKIGASIHIDTILRTSVEELGKALEDSEVIIQMSGNGQKGGNNE
jgi:GAF domain-containing protein/HAMP domain-containing protein